MYRLVGAHRPTAAPPLKDVSVSIKVCTRQETRRRYGGLDCTRLFDCHILDAALRTAQLEEPPTWFSCARGTFLTRRCDGRHPRLLNAILEHKNAFLFKEVAKIVLKICSYANATEHGPADPVSCIFFCNQGRHRSVAMASMFAIVLTSMGAIVHINYVDPTRLCTCTWCTREYEVTMQEINAVADNLTASLCIELRQNRPMYSENAVGLATEIVEFVDHDLVESDADST